MNARLKVVYGGDVKQVIVAMTNLCNWAFHEGGGGGCAIHVLLTGRGSQIRKFVDNLDLSRGGRLQLLPYLWQQLSACVVSCIAIVLAARPSLADRLRSMPTMHALCLRLGSVSLLP